ncbi:MAG: hypothetical protein GX029_01345 [Pseudomonadaceae bacterium]|nr:hypothetical protein [Pseudomonadaceae bacterium]
MFGKLLVILIVGSSVYFLWRKQQGSSNLKNLPKTQFVVRQGLNPPTDTSQPPVKLIFSGVLAVVILATAAWMVYDWKDQRRLLEVSIMTPNKPTSLKTYQVYKKDLQERGFITKEGQIVRIANSERMEVRLLEPR